MQHLLDNNNIFLNVSSWNKTRLVEANDAVDQIFQCIHDNFAHDLIYSGLLNFSEAKLFLQLGSIMRAYLRKREPSVLPLAYASISSIQVEIERLEQIL